MSEKQTIFTDTEFEIDYVDLGGGTPGARVQVPFSVRVGHESEKDFYARADRDFAIIKNFSAKQVANEQVLARDEANIVLTDLKIRMTENVAYLEGFLKGPENDALKKLCSAVRRMALDNLPKGYVKNIGAPAEPEPKRKPKPRVIRDLAQMNFDDMRNWVGKSEKARVVLESPGPLIIEVPDP